jgi:hypothetical protein
MADYLVWLCVLCTFAVPIIPSTRQPFPEETFPPVCPFTIEEILSDEAPGDEPKAM